MSETRLHKRLNSEFKQIPTSHNTTFPLFLKHFYFKNLRQWMGKLGFYLGSPRCLAAAQVVAQLAMKRSNMLQKF